MNQAQLFAPEPASEIKVPGFSLVGNYISADEERRLLTHIDAAPWENDWRRRIQQYGLGYANEHGGAATWLRDLPDWLLPLAERVGVDADFERFPENCVINEYIPPLGIGPHKDYPAFGRIIACVSLGSDVVIDFKHPGKGLHVPVLVPRRSFWIIKDEARFIWTHGIATRLNDVVNGEKKPRERRISITFRTAKNVSGVPRDKLRVLPKQQ